MNNVAVLADNRQTYEVRESRFAKHRKSLPVEREAFSNAADLDHSQHELGCSIFQYVGTSLEGGPRGVHPPTHIAALSAIAGYAARFAISMKTARGEADDDFRLVPVDRSTTIIVSEQVNSLVLAMEKPSIAGIVLSAALRCGLQQIPDMNALLQKHLSDSGFVNGMPSDHGPDVPPETLLMMYWEQVARFFRSTSNHLEIAPLAAAHAVGEAIGVYRDAMPVDQSLGLALNTAIAMSKVNRTF